MERSLEAPSAVLMDPRRNLSVVLGGPLYQMLHRSRLCDDTLRHVRRRVVIFVAICWLPLLVLSALSGSLIRHADLTVPFLLDMELHSRLLVAMPLLILAELVLHQRMLPVVGTFLDRRLIPEAAIPQFEAAIATATRQRNSVAAEVIMIFVVYAVGILVLYRQFIALDVTTWHSSVENGVRHATTAGLWFAFVSLPVFQFMLVRWYYRIFVWVCFVWNVSRIRLDLFPTHPDRVAGLGFLSVMIHALAPLALAHGALLAGVLAARVIHTGASLLDFQVEIGVLVGFMLLLVVTPLLLFTPQLAEAKRIASREYGNLAMRYVRDFDSKWLRGAAPADEKLVGSGDIQSLADLTNSLEVVRSMRIVPVALDDLIRLAVITVAPIAPLLLTVMPMRDLAKLLLGIIM